MVGSWVGLEHRFRLKAHAVALITLDEHLKVILGSVLVLDGLRSLAVRKGKDNVHFACSQIARENQANGFLDFLIDATRGVDKGRGNVAYKETN